MLARRLGGRLDRAYRSGAALGTWFQVDRIGGWAFVTTLDLEQAHSLGGAGEAEKERRDHRRVD